MSECCQKVGTFLNWMKLNGSWCDFILSFISNSCERLRKGCCPAGMGLNWNRAQHCVLFWWAFTSNIFCCLIWGIYCCNSILVLTFILHLNQDKIFFSVKYGITREEFILVCCSYQDTFRLQRKKKAPLQTHKRLRSVNVKRTVWFDRNGR